MNITDKLLDFNEIISFKIIDWIDNLFFVINKFSFYTANIIVIIINSLINIICKVFVHTYTVLRWSTIPFNWLIIRTWLFYVFRGGEYTPLDRVGVHFLFAPPGGFKSLLLKTLADEVNERDHKGVYLSHSIEKSKIDQEGNHYLNNRKIDIKSYFDLDDKSPTAGSQIKRFNFKKYPELYLDEFHLDNNNRENRTKEYNLFFKPLLESFIKMRHDGCRRIILASQVPNNDRQLMPLLAGFHVLNGKKGIRWSEWLKTGKFNYRPIKVVIYSYRVDPFNPEKKKLERKWVKSISVENLADFDSYALRDSNQNLPLDFE